MGNTGKRSPLTPPHVWVPAVLTQMHARTANPMHIHHLLLKLRKCDENCVGVTRGAGVSGTMGGTGLTGQSGLKGSTGELPLV